MFQKNEHGGEYSECDGVKTLIVTQHMLKEYNDENGPFFGVVSVILKYFPDILLDMNTYCEGELNEAARDAILNSSTYRGDILYMTRVWFMAVETILNNKGVYFKFRFPYVEMNE
jgi:hypothetical protein